MAADGDAIGAMTRVDGPAGDAIYLDHAAATPLDGRVAEAMRRAEAVFANPSSPHAAGRRARAVLEDARGRILGLLGGRTSGTRDRLVFTGSATEANRLAVLGAAGTGPGTVAVSARDHPSVELAAAELGARGWAVERLPLASDGTASAAASAVASGRDGRRIVCLAMVCGQTGIRESLRPLVAVHGDGNLLVHADATQAVAWDGISFRDLPLTSLAFAPSKFGGPRGIAAVIVRGDVVLAPLVPGTQELGLRGGTEAVALAVGFATAVELAVAAREALARRILGLRERFERGLAAIVRGHGFEPFIVGGDGDRAPHLATIAVRGCDRQAVVMACDLEGVCLATGTACASGSSEPSPAIAALPVPGWVVRGAFRASLGATTTDRDVDAALGRMDRVFCGFAAAGLHRRAGAG